MPLAYTQMRKLGTVLDDVSSSAGVVKTRMGGWWHGAIFSRRRKGGMVIIYREMAYAKMFYGGMVLFSGETPSPRIPPQLEYWSYLNFLANTFTSNFVHLKLQKHCSSTARYGNLKTRGYRYL